LAREYGFAAEEICALVGKSFNTMIDHDPTGATRKNHCSVA
jgi:hypothetical protein